MYAKYNNELKLLFKEFSFCHELLLGNVLLHIKNCVGLALEKYWFSYIVYALDT